VHLPGTLAAEFIAVIPLWVKSCSLVEVLMASLIKTINKKGKIRIKAFLVNFFIMFS
jgi:hypothetical protein